MPVVVTQHAVDRLRQRFPAYAAWADDEIACRLKWLARRAVEVGNGHGKRWLRAGGVTLIVTGRVVLTVQPAAWASVGMQARHVGRRVRGRRVFGGGLTREA